MIIIRDVFRLKPGQADNAEPILRQLLEHETRAGIGPGRIMIDRTGAHFPHLAGEDRFVVEREFPTFDAFRERQDAAHADPELGRAWQACKPVVQKINREILETIP